MKELDHLNKETLLNVILMSWVTICGGKLNEPHIYFAKCWVLSTNSISDFSTASF